MYRKLTILRVVDILAEQARLDHLHLVLLSLPVESLEGLQPSESLFCED